MKHTYIIIVLFKLSCTTESKTQVKTVIHLEQGKHHKKSITHQQKKITFKRYLHFCTLEEKPANNIQVAGALPEYYMN